MRDQERVCKEIKQESEREREVERERSSLSSSVVGGGVWGKRSSPICTFEFGRWGRKRERGRSA